MLREKFVESPSSIGQRARNRRASHFIATFPDLAEMDVLDLGGTALFWKRLSIRPRSVTTLNVVPDRGTVAEPWCQDVVGDACEPPPSIADQTFDLVFSNSTIEHVGDHARRKLFADTVHRQADMHWVQTPNRAFPIEPHVLFPFEQFFPRTGRALVHRYWPLVHTNARTMDVALHAADATELLWRSEFKQLFPTSRLEIERILRGLPGKSLLAIRT